MFSLLNLFLEGVRRTTGKIYTAGSDTETTKCKCLVHQIHDLSIFVLNFDIDKWSSQRTPSPILKSFVHNTFRRNLKEVSMEAQNLISKMLEPDPVKRSVSHLNISRSSHRSKLKILVIIHSITSWLQYHLKHIITLLTTFRYSASEALKHPWITGEGHFDVHKRHMPDVAKSFRDTFTRKVQPDRPGHMGPNGESHALQHRLH